MRAKRLPISGLYAITDETLLLPERLPVAVEGAIRGGAALIQYRNKHGSALRRTEEAGALSALCRKMGVLFIVNDDPALAHEVAADGVHIGQRGTTYERARAILGPAAIIGISCHDSLADALAAQAAGADYVAFGRFFPSKTKPHAVPAPVSLLGAARRQLSVPIVAIGGVTPENGGTLVEAGAELLAAIEGVFGQPDAEAAARRYAEIFHARHKSRITA